MTTEAELKVVDAHSTATEALLILLIQQMADAGQLDVRRLSNTVAEHAERTFISMKKNPQPDDQILALSARKMKSLSRMIVREPEHPEFRPIVLTGKSGDPEPA